MTRPDVELRLPGDGAYVAALRTTTAALAARLDFTLEAIEDARMAVGEAAALALEAADPGSDLTTSFWHEPGRLLVTVTVSATQASHPDRDSFAWTVLATVADAHCEIAEGTLSISFATTSLLGTHPVT